MSSGFNSTNPFGERNPYASPIGQGGANWNPEAARGKILPPAIALIVVGGIGLVASLFNVITALSGAPLPVDPNAPELVKQMQQGAVGPVAIVMQSAFILVNVVIIFGGAQMARMQMRPLGITASVLAMLNIGSCCCIIGLPVGIWSLVILLMADVAAAFNAQSTA
jgi:hypothetical protein